MIDMKNLSISLKIKMKTSTFYEPVGEISIPYFITPDYRTAG